MITPCAVQLSVVQQPAFLAFQLRKLVNLIGPYHLCVINSLSCYKVCLREKRPIPYIVSCCVREVERRGLDEVGIYRVSGLATDISKLRKAFDTRKLFTCHFGAVRMLMFQLFRYRWLRIRFLTQRC